MLRLYFAQCLALHKCSSLFRTGKEMSIWSCVVSHMHPQGEVGCIKAMSLTRLFDTGAMVRFNDGSTGFMGGVTYITLL